MDIWTVSSLWLLLQRLSRTIIYIYRSYLLLFSPWLVSNSLWPHGLQPARLLCPWDIRVGCHFLVQVCTSFSGMHVVWAVDLLGCRVFVFLIVFKVIFFSFTVIPTCVPKCLVRFVLLTVNGALTAPHIHQKPSSDTRLSDFVVSACLASKNWCLVRFCFPWLIIRLILAILTPFFSSIFPFFYGLSFSSWSVDFFYMLMYRLSLYILFIQNESVFDYRCCK